MVAPKIEEISTTSTVKKNPFATKEKKKTIRRDPKDIYNFDELKKGLNKPQYLRNSPLDKLFYELETILDGTLDEITLGGLGDALEISLTDEVDLRYAVISKLLDYLLQIKDYSSKQDHLDKNLIAISLHDIKTFSKLVNLIIIHGIYPALSTFKVGIPLAKRRLNDFTKTQKPIKVATIQQDLKAKSYTERYLSSYEMLTLLYKKLLIVFDGESDVRDLLVKGTGYSDFLTVTITLITCPYFPQDKKQWYNKQYNDFVSQLPGTFELFQTFSLYLSSPSPAFFKLFVLKNLQSLHYNAPHKDGLLTLIEFVLGLRENEDINIEKFDNVANVVLAKPSDISTAEYFTSIGNQSYDLLVNINRPYVTSCVGHIIERLWAKNQLVVTDFFLKKIWNVLTVDDKSSDFGVLVYEKDLNNVVNVLISLTKKGMSDSLTNYIFKPILPVLWTYFVYLKTTEKSSEVILNIIVGYFVVMSTSNIESDTIYGLDTISKNLLADNNYEFLLGPNDLPQVVIKESQMGDSKDKRMNRYLSDLDSSCAAFMELVKNLDDDFVMKMFKVLLSRWLKIDNGDKISNENPFIVLIDLRLIESMVNEFKEDIAKTPEGMLDIVLEFLENYKAPTTSTKSQLEVSDSDDDSDDEEEYQVDVNTEAMPVLLELLSAVITEATCDELDEQSIQLLKKISTRLQNLLKSPDSLIKQNSKAITSLNSRIQDILKGEDRLVSKNDLQKKTLERAITSLNDPLVPIRAHGLYLLRQLIESRSDVISVDFVVDLHLVQLKDPEPFIYLNVIKGLESLIDIDRNEVVPILIKIYVNEEGNQEVDERLKIGEVLLRFIQNSNEMFSGNLSNLIVNSMILMIRRHSDKLLDQDIRIRMSSMSLLGLCCKTNPLGMIDSISDAIECALGILQLEKSDSDNVMRRSAVVLIHDLIIGTSNTEDVPFPREHQQKVFDTLVYILETDEDLLTREQANKVLEDIKELLELAYEHTNQK